MAIVGVATRIRDLTQLRDDGLPTEQECRSVLA